MRTDPLAGFHFVGGGSGGGGGGYAPANSATGLYYSPVEGFYDSISQTHLTGAARDASGAVNPYEVEGDRPTATAIVMADPPENSASPVGVMQSSGEGPDFAWSTAAGCRCTNSSFLTRIVIYGGAEIPTSANTCFRLAWASRLLLIQRCQRIRN